MSVVKSQRQESTMEFLKNARDLELFTIRKAANFPKRYTFYVSQDIVKIASNIHTYAKMGNSIYPVNQHEVQSRRDCFQRALACTQVLVSKVELAAELFPIKESSMEYWMNLVWKEERLLKAAMKKDRERFKEIFRHGE